MLECLESGGSLFPVVQEQKLEEFGEFGGRRRLESGLLGQQLVEADAGHAQIGAQSAVGRVRTLGKVTGERQVLGRRPKQRLDQRHVVFCDADPVVGLRREQKAASRQLVRHARHAPNVRRRTVLGADYHLKSHKKN